jgi:hypothetical protein
MTEWIRKPFWLEGVLLAASFGIYFYSTFFIFAISKWDERLQGALKIDSLGWRMPIFFVVYFLVVLALFLAAAFFWPVTVKQLCLRCLGMLAGHLVAWAIGRYGYAFFLFPAIWITLLLSAGLGYLVSRSRLG